MASALIPISTVALLVALGAVLRRAMPAQRFWLGVERLTYFVLFPALLVHSLSETGVTLLASWKLVVAVLATILLAAILTILLRGAIDVGDRQFSSVFQGATRFNTYIILSLSNGLAGSAGIATASIALAAMIVLSNVLAVSALLYYGGTGRARADPVRLLRSLASNPLILACLAGLALNLAGLTLPPVVDETVRMLGQPALALGLLAVGAALTARTLRTHPRALVATSAIKLLVQPLLVIALAHVLGLSGVTFLVALICAGAPVAPSSAIMARQLGGDVELMAGLVTATTCLSAVTLSLFLLAAQALA